MERSLSRNEAKVILDLEWRGKETVTLDELRQELNASDAYVRYVAHMLVKKGWLERLRPGLFQLVPADRGRDGVGDTNPLAAGAVLVSPYFFSFGTACTYHGLTEQVFAEVYLACRERRRPKIIRDKRYVFVHVCEERFFGFGKVSVLGRSVLMATVERALLDAIDRPRYAGGIGEVSQVLARAGTKVSWNGMVDCCRHWGSSALVQRLGYLVDLHGLELPTGCRARLVHLIRPSSKIQLGPRRKWGSKGKLVTPWNIIENVPRKVLMLGQDGLRRRATFPIRESNR